MKKSAIVLSSFVLAAAAFGAENQKSAVEQETPCTPVELCLASPVQYPCPACNVYGVRLSLAYGQSADVYGLDLGLVGRTRGNFAGAAVGGYNWVENKACGVQLALLSNQDAGEATGLQLAGVLNGNRGPFVGAQLALVNYDHNFSGVQVAALNWNYAYSAGLQAGLVNVGETAGFAGAALGLVNVAKTFDGVQVGFVNTASESVTGVQVGLFNAARELTGLQFGLVNIAGNATLPILPFCNGSF